jgi:hypothetical protein
MRGLACFALFGIAMEAVYWFAHGVVDNFGAMAGLVVGLLMYIAALHYERRQQRRTFRASDLEILPPDHLIRRR